MLYRFVVYWGWFYYIPHHPIISIYFGGFSIFVFKHYLLKLRRPSLEKGKLRLPNTELTLAFPSIL